jgi:hypothetical protein
MSTSREYAKFKRLFVGALLPRKIRRLRSIGFTPPMPIKFDNLLKSNKFEI